MRATDSRRHGERGQSTAFVASLLFVLVLFVGVVADVGQAVNRRIALQVVADAGAYTGASVMAVGMNQLATWNTALQYAWLAFTAPPTGLLPQSPVYMAFQTGVADYPCVATEGWIRAWSAVRLGLNTLYQGLNLGYGQLAHSEAVSASDFNVADLLPGERLTYAEFDSVAAALADPMGAIPPARNAVWLDDSRQVEDGTPPKAIGILRYIPFARYYIIPSRRRLSYSCITQKFPFIERHTHQFTPTSPDGPTWYRKSDGVASFVWTVKAPATRALMFDSFFGGNAIPEMKAVAVAKPIRGDIERGRHDYVAKMVPVATVMALNRVGGSWLPPWLTGWTTDSLGTIADPKYDRGRRIVVH